MPAMTCEKCGSNSFFESDGYNICAFCRTKYAMEKKEASSVDLAGDIERLLQKCEANPSKAQRYASLILDIDPTNEKALGYLA